MIELLHPITRGFAVLLLASFAATSSADLITVNVLSDTGKATGDCELRSAILAANSDTVVDSCVAGSGSDVIEFTVTGTINLSSDLPDIDRPVEINGPLAGALVISGGGQYRQLNFVANSGAVAVRQLVLSQGFNAGAGGCLRAGNTSLVIERVIFAKCGATSQGGAMAITGPLLTSIAQSQFNSNQSDLSGGAIFATTGPVNIVDSTFDGNIAQSGGAIAMNLPTINVLRSTFNDNSATASGGAIEVQTASAAVVITSSTISGNVADSDADGGGGGGGIAVSSGSLTLENSIVSGNTDMSPTSPNPDILLNLPLLITSNGYNLIGRNEGAETDFPAGNPNVSLDYVGTIDAPISADLLALGSYGGTVNTMPPSNVSPAVDQGHCPGETADQRGFFNAESGLRINDLVPDNASDACDIGSVELPLLPEGVFANGFED